MNTPEEKSPEPVSPEGRDLSIKFTLIFGLFAFIPLVLMYHFMSVKKTPVGSEGEKERTAGGPTPPAITFKNITAEAGISFTRESGARGEKLLPETMGSGCAFFDFDRSEERRVGKEGRSRWS